MTWPPRVSRRYTFFGLFLLCAFATVFNWSKAFHIDDTAYLEMAQWIAANPLRPMSGTVFWGNVPEPIHHINQPPLYPYLMAAWAGAFGWSEASMHALMALFAVSAIVLMHRLAVLVVPDRAMFATTLTVASPPFVVGQNTMVDVPVLALWLLFFVVMLGRRWRNEPARYALAGLVCGAAILVKYTSLVLLPVFAIVAFLRQKREPWWGLGVAMAIVIAWCAFNYLDYGGIHLMTRKSGPGAFAVLDPGKWLLCLGAAAPATFAVAGAALWRAGALGRRAAAALVLGALATVVMVVLACLGPLRPSTTNAVLAVSFVASGTLLVVLAGIAAARHAREREFAVWMLVYWAAGVTAFILLLAPFLAMRHALLALPPLILLAVLATKERLTRTWSALAIASLVATTAVVASADAWYADLYRQQAARLRATLPPDAKVWTVGHWGWQHYARQQGMLQFVPGASKLAPGDFLVYPERVHHQSLPEGVVLTRMQAIAATPMSCIERLAAPNAGFYATTAYMQLPWSVRRTPLEYFLVSRVERVEPANR